MPSSVGTYARTPEIRAKQSAALRGRTFTLEHRRRMSRAASMTRRSATLGFYIKGARYVIRLISGWEFNARVTWVQHHGPIPEGFLIHHDDEDSFNDEIENLRALSNPEHGLLHKNRREGL